MLSAQEDSKRQATHALMPYIAKLDLNTCREVAKHTLLCILAVFLFVVVVFTYFFLSVVYLSYTLSVVSTYPVIRQGYIFRIGRRLTYAAVRISDDPRCLVYIDESMIRCIYGRYFAWCSVDEDASPISSPRWTPQVHIFGSTLMGWFSASDQSERLQGWSTRLRQRRVLCRNSGELCRATAERALPQAQRG